MVWSLFIIDLMGLFFYTKIGFIISIGDLPTTNIIEPIKITPLKIQYFQGVCLSCDDKRGRKEAKISFAQNVISNLQSYIIQWIMEISWCEDLEMETRSTDCYSSTFFSYVKPSLRNQFVLFGPVRQQIYGLEETGHFPA